MDPFPSSAPHPPAWACYRHGMAPESLGVDPTIFEPDANWGLVGHLPDGAVVSLEFRHPGAPVGSVPDIVSRPPTDVMILGEPCSLDEIGDDCADD